MQVDRAEVRAALLEAVGRVVARLTHRTIVQEVLVEFWFADCLVVVAFAEFVDGQSVLRSVGLDDVRKVRRLGLRRNTHAFRAVTREPGLRVYAGLRNPYGMILFDGRLYRALKPLSVSIKIRPIKLIVDLKRHVGEERWLRTGEIVGAAAVEDLVVVFDLKDEVLHETLGHLYLAINEKSEGDEVGIPIVQLYLKRISSIGGRQPSKSTDLVEASSGYDEWNALKGSPPAPVIDFVHGESQNSRLAIETLDEIGVARVRRENLHIEVEVRLFGGDLSVIFNHCRLAMRNIDPRLNAPRAVLGVRADDFEAIAVDAPGKGVPEGILDHA